MKWREKGREHGRNNKEHRMKQYGIPNEVYWWTVFGQPEDYISGIKWGHQKAMPTKEIRGMRKANFTDFLSFPELEDK